MLFAISRHFRATATAVALISAPFAVARGQATAPVDPADPVYRVIARLAAERLIDTIVVGQRPYSRRAIAHMLNEAERNRTRLDATPKRAPLLLALLARERARFAREIDALAGDRGRSWGISLPVDRVTMDATALESPDRIIPGAGLGSLNAVTNPLVDNRQGRFFYTRDVTLGIEAATRLQLGRYAAASFTPNVRGNAGAFTGFDDPQVNALALSTLLKNVHLEVGKEYISWGQTPTGGLAASWNHGAMYQARVSSDLAFVLPSFLRRIGPMRGTLVMATLGEDQQRYDHSKWISYKVSIEPHPRLELGVAVVDEMGGGGAPPATFAKRVADVVPLIDVIFIGDSDLQFSNKLAGADVRWRVPNARGLELFAESMLDDFDVRRIASSLWEDNGIIAGFTLPRLTESGVWSLEGEAHHTGLRYYEHAQFSSGLSYRARLIGDAIGPRANAGYLTLGYEPSAKMEWRLSSAYEWRSNDQYIVPPSGPHDKDFRFERVEIRPKERRARATLAWTYTAGPFGSRIMVESGIERVTNFSFINGEDRTNGLVRVGFEYRP